MTSRSYSVGFFSPLLDNHLFWTLLDEIFLLLGIPVHKKTVG